MRRGGLYFIVVMMALAIAPHASAQIVTVDELVVVKNDVNIVLSCLLSVTESAVSTDHQLILTPCLYNDASTVDLQSVVVNGRQKRKRMVQQAYLKHEQYKPKFEGSNGSLIAYSATFPYEDWMGRILNCRFEVVRQGCCKTEYLASIDAASNIELFPVATELITVKPRVSATMERTKLSPFLRPVNAEDSTLTNRGTPIRFKQGHVEIDFSFELNRQTMTRINSDIDMLLADSTAKLDRITIAGFASPEGDPLLNYNLSYQRAVALRDTIQHRYNFSDDNFDLIAGGEDWEGLRELIYNSSMPFRNELLQIIDSTPDSRTRKRLIEQLDNGRPYKSMFDIFYPQLRDACYIRIWFEEIPDKVADVINNSLMFIEVERIAQAMALLETVEYDSRSWNVIGTCYLLRGDIDNARSYFQKAAQVGDVDAQANLELIKSSSNGELENISISFDESVQQDSTLNVNPTDMQ